MAFWLSTLHALGVLQEGRVSPGYGQEKSACRRFEAGILGQLTRIDRSVESQNAIVYFKRVPAELPAPLAPRILAEPRKFEAPAGPLEEGKDLRTQPTGLPGDDEAGALPPEWQRRGCRILRRLARPLPHRFPVPLCGRTAPPRRAVHRAPSEGPLPRVPLGQRPARPGPRPGPRSAGPAGGRRSVSCNWNHGDRAAPGMGPAEAGPPSEAAPP